MPSESDSSRARDRLLGRVLGGQFRIEGHLGTGGFGEVYRAVQEKTGQQVALKLLKPRYGKGAPTMERQLARFRREMKVCAELHHPHVVRLIDSGETESGLLFSVFEYVPGPTLAELLREKGALTVRATIELMAHVLDALVCAHGKGVIHRDLKPNNIIISTTGARAQAIVLDFGISAFLEGTIVDEFKSLTVTREILGTPAYAAPEQLRGEQPTVKSDLYAWGLVFLECITGRRVFDGASSMEIAHRQLSADPVVLPARLQKHWLGGLLRWTLEKDATRRAGDAALLMQRLMEKRSLGDLVDGNGFLVQDAAAGTALPAPASGPITTAPSVTSGGSAERRQVTALCCSIGIRPTQAARTPEALDQALRDAHDLCLQVAGRFGGHAAGNLGGQVLVYFGFPRASDTDARRAAVVALEIAHEIHRRQESFELPIEVRIGLHTGVVTTTGAGQAISPMFGVTPSLAAQLALQAPTNGILVSAETFPYLVRSFELESLTSPRGEGIYRLVAESRAESASPGSSRTPFVGRARELGELQQAWERTRAGQGTTVMVVGEAGIGKSRLARELRAGLEKARAQWLEGRCLPETENSPLHPLVDLLLHELGVTPGTGAEGARHLEASLEPLGVPLATAVPLLCPWMGLPLLAPHKPLEFSPQRQRALLLELVVDLLVNLAERQDAPILIEDLHWADPTTLECVGLLIRKVQGRRCLLLLTTRPGATYQPPPDLQTLALGSLGRAEVEMIVEALIGREAFSRPLVDDVVQRADGIPLFVEEIVRFLETTTAPASASGDRVEVPRGAVPASLRDLLTSRLDQLGQAKETAQVAAAIGREFDYRLLASVLAADEGALLLDLEQMVSANLLVRRRHVENPAYMFRHALIRDAAYWSIPPKQLALLHQKIAQTLLATFPEVVEAQPELLASHHERAGMVGPAIAEWLRAGRRGMERGPSRETILHLRRALALVPQIPDEKERMQRELELQLTLAPALMTIQGWGSPDTGVACTRARDLCRALDDQMALFPALWGLWTFQFVGGDLVPALVTAQQTQAMATAAGRAELLIAARHAVGFTHFFRGELPEARDQGAWAVEHYDPAQEREVVRIFQLSSSMACGYFHAAALWMLGQPDDAEQALVVAERRARELGHPFCTASALGFGLTTLHHHLQDVERTKRVADELYALSIDQGFDVWIAVAHVYRAWARAHLGEHEQGIKDLRAAIGAFRQTGSRLVLVAIHAMLAECLMLAGRPEEARTVLGQGLEEAATRAEHVGESELHRLRAESLRRTDAAAAEAAFRDALAIARKQQARVLSLRAAVGLGELLRDGGRAAEARALVQEEYGWFTQGFETGDLKRARALLQTLGKDGGGG